MTKVTDINAYKKAKIVVKDLLNTLGVIHSTIKQLERYSKYTQVADCISVLDQNKTLLEIHLNKYKRVLENKGKDDIVEEIKK